MTRLLFFFALLASRPAFANCENYFAGLAQGEKRAEVRIGFNEENAPVYSTLVTQRLWVLLTASNPSVRVAGPDSVVINVRLGQALPNQIMLVPARAVDNATLPEITDFIERLNIRSQKGDEILKELVSGHRDGDLYRAQIISTDSLPHQVSLIRLARRP